LQPHKGFCFDFYFCVSTPFTHPRKDPLEAVAQWNLVVKESCTPQIFGNKKAAFLEAAESHKG
jgi:hypothetical protein